MISILLIIISSSLLIVCFCCKVFFCQLSPRKNRLVSLIIPIICLFSFILAFFFNAQQMKDEQKELDVLLESVLDTKLSNRVYISNEDKYNQIDYLKVLLSRVDSIANDNSISSFISGSNDEIEKKITKTREVIQGNIKWLNRLNDFYLDSVRYDDKHQNTNTIRLIEPSIDDLHVLNIAFKYILPIDSIVCAYVEVQRENEIIYAKAFKNKAKVNCFNIPNDTKYKGELKLGYIKKDNDRLVFNYIKYGRE